MKKYLLVSLMLTFSFAVPAQQRYYVSVVKGIVFNAAGEKITVGSKLGKDDMLVFSSKNSVPVLMDPEKGRLVLAPKDSATQSFTGTVKEFLQLQPKTIRASAVKGRR